MRSQPRIIRCSRWWVRHGNARCVLRVVVAVCLGLGFSVGCQAGKRNYVNENDKLRSQNLNLTRTVTKLEKSLAMRLAQIDGLEQRLGHTVKVAGVTSSDIPRLVSVVFGRLSGAVDTNNDHVDDTLRLYVQTLDQHGRFIPVAAVAEVQVVMLCPGKPPVELTDRTWEPKAFEQSYRSSLAGTHYTLELPLLLDQPDAVDPVTVKLSLTDAATGVRLSCQQAVTINSEPRVDSQQM